MAILTLSQIVGESPILLPPSLITGRFLTSSAGSYQVRTLGHGLSQTASTTSATLTEVLNISGGGVIEFLAIMSGSASVIGKWRIVIDGVTVLDEASVSLADTIAFCAVGSVRASSSTGVQWFIDFGVVVFKKSLVVSQAGNGTAPVYTLYSRRLVA